MDTAASTPPPASSSRPLRFVHRGRVVELTDPPPTRTVLQWLREDARCTGTKEGCNEGDCGACTVVVGERTPAGTLALQPVNACIRLLPTLDGKALFTVEDLAPSPRQLHPVQQALVDAHGSQCGFCTPGFVMSLWATCQRHAAAGTRPTRQQIADDLSGNLCRCTGYRPILDAGERLFEGSFDAPPARLDAAPVLQALQQLAADPPLRLRSGTARFDAPRSEDTLADLLASHPEARLLAGSTDVGLWITKQLRPLPHLVYTGEVASLRTIEEREGTLHIGAAASLEDAWAALVRLWPPLAELWRRFAGLPTRVAGTMGGNVANGSPIGDSAPALLALDATLRLRRGTVLRRVPLRGFYTGYMRNALQPGEYLQAIELPLPAAAAPPWQVRAYKISKRHDGDISAVCAALAVQLHGDRVAAVRLAFGGMAATVQRAAQAEAALVGQAWAEPALQAAMAALAQDFTPLSDLRASAAYRLRVAQNLLRRFWLETRPQDALHAQDVSVFARPGLVSSQRPTEHPMHPARP
jgi:xanthine dehydrogenase small subunit